MKTLQVEIMKRFLTAKELEALFGQYQQVRRINGVNGKDRGINLDQQIKPEELEVLSIYLFDTDIPLSEVCEKLGFKDDASLYHSACRTALKYLRQNGGILDKRNS